MHSYFNIVQIRGLKGIKYKYVFDPSPGINDEQELWPRMNHIDGLVQERRNSSALAVELHLSCTIPSLIQVLWCCYVIMNEYPKCIELYKPQLLWPLQWDYCLCSMHPSFNIQFIKTVSPVCVPLLCPVEWNCSSSMHLTLPSCYVQLSETFCPIDTLDVMTSWVRLSVQ